MEASDEVPELDERIFTEAVQISDGVCLLIIIQCYHYFACVKTCNMFVFSEHIGPTLASAMQTVGNVESSVASA